MKDNWHGLKNKILERWNRGTDSTQNAWDDTVDTVTDSYEGLKDWSTEEVNEARKFFKQKFNNYKK